MSRFCGVCTIPPGVHAPSKKAVTTSLTIGGTAPAAPVHTMTTTEYICPFASSVRNGSIFGVQFHPEKSGAVGLRLLKNYIDLV